MGFCWILVYLMWFAHLSVLHAEMCRPNRRITLIIDPSPPPRGTPLPPPPTQCSGGCMTLRCGPKTTVTYLPNNMLCYLKGMLSNMPCCREHSRQRMGQGNTMQRQNITCKLVIPDHGGTENSDTSSGDDRELNSDTSSGDDREQNSDTSSGDDRELNSDTSSGDDRELNSDTSSGDDRELKGGIIGTLIVLLLLAIFIVLLIQILRKRQHGHTPPGEGSGYHNSGTKNTYTPREPSPYECPATRWPNSQEYAELEGQGPYGCSNGYTEQYQQHLYEDADKNVRTINDEEFTNPGFEVTGEVNGEKPQFQCIGTQPPEDDYANPDDAVTNNKVPNQTNTQETTAVDEPQTQEIDQHNYAVLEDDSTTFEGNVTANDRREVEEEEETETCPASVQD